MFKDEAIIDVTGGHGGAGVVSWRREKFVSKGGPDGGDGGKGGDIYLLADGNTDTLSHFLSKKVHKAKPGGNGMKRKKHGKNGDDLFLTVPPGTQVFENGDIVADLDDVGDQVVIAKGGRGGYGNAHFKSSVRQRPDFAELGEPGDHHELRLELKLVADVGIIGLPSVGKSSLIRAISSAKPKVAEYEFTTLVPNLGVVTVDDRSYVVCDVPGLIEGASDGKGLGHQFLKHIERCGLLIHLLDASHNDLLEDYRTIRKELEAYSPILSSKKELIVINKSDLVENIQTEGLDVFATISAATGEGINDLAKSLIPIVLEERDNRATSEASTTDVPVLRPQEDGVKMGQYTIEEQDDGSVRISGKRLEQLVVMTDFSNEGAVRRFRDVCTKIGLDKALQKYGPEAKIIIGETDISQYL